MNIYKVIFKNGQFCKVIADSLLNAKMEAARVKGLDAALSGIREVRLLKRLVVRKERRKLCKRN